MRASTSIPESRDGFDVKDWNYLAYGCGDANDPSANGISEGVCRPRMHQTSFDGGVHVWSVYYDSGGGEEFAEWTEQNLVQGVGKAYWTNDSEELTTILLEIASSIPVVITR